jgi:hypothetical protein
MSTSSESVRSFRSFHFLREDIDPAVRSLNSWSDIGAAEPQNPYLEMRLEKRGIRPNLKIKD